MAPQPPPPPLAALLKIPRGKRGGDAVVRCKGFRCAAYLDSEGVWRSPADGQALEVIEVLMRF